MVWFGVLQLYFVTKVILFCTRFWGGEEMSHPQRLLAMSLLGKEFQFPIFRVITLHHSGWTPATFGSQSFVPISVNFKSVILTAVVNFSCIALISVALIAALL